MTFANLLGYSDYGLFLLRLVVGIVFIVHALPKVKNSQGMASMMGARGMGPMVMLLGLVEVLSGLALIIGWYMQLASLLLAIVMVGAIFMKITKWGVPFAAADKTGWEFDLTLFAANLVILLGGGGLIMLL